MSFSTTDDHEDVGVSQEEDLIERFDELETSNSGNVCFFSKIDEYSIDDRLSSFEHRTHYADSKMPIVYSTGRVEQGKHGVGAEVYIGADRTPKS